MSRTAAGFHRARGWRLIVAPLALGKNGETTSSFSSNFGKCTGGWKRLHLFHLPFVWSTNEQPIILLRWRGTKPVAQPVPLFWVGSFTMGSNNCCCGASGSIHVFRNVFRFTTSGLANTRALGLDLGSSRHPFRSLPHSTPRQCLKNMKAASLRNQANGDDINHSGHHRHRHQQHHNVLGKSATHPRISRPLLSGSSHWRETRGSGRPGARTA